MPDPLSEIMAEADRVHSAADEIEIALMGITTAEDWRIALGYVDEASNRMYQVKRHLFDEARKRANQHHKENYR